MIIPPIFSHFVILIALYALLAMAFNFAVSYGRILPFAHVAIFGVGAYTSAILTSGYGVSFTLGFLAAIGSGVLVTVFLAIAIRRVQRDSLALIFLLFALSCSAFVLQIPAETRAVLGLEAVSRPPLLAVSSVYAAVVVGALIILYGIVARVTRSPFGLVASAMREDEINVRMMGKNTIHVARAVLVFSGAVAGLAGALYVHYVGFIDPSFFSFTDLLIILAAVVVGGVGSFPGSILGVIICFFLPETLRFFSLPEETMMALRHVVLGTFLLLVIIVRPKGIMGKVNLE